ncbi:hypothetical protein C1H46_000591 [Malus baccata]|uniref:Uncharacterized protein n=1 Tax=Malus baccata TaxID=106549 RepID=A0A540NRA9_MALBA|nr:hypothetical protein C1H46_000591 [Malus baccata]
MRRNDKLHYGLTPRRDFPSNPVWVSLENTLVRFFKLFRDVFVHCMPDLVKFGSSFNSRDKFPRFPVRAMIFRLILGYHRPPNGPEEDFETPGVVTGRIVAACGTVVDGAWSTGTSTGRMTAFQG